MNVRIIKKAAMFGLDARIALAIFGALSVISGAALYSAIQQANTESYRQLFEELTKASEQYYLDNGKPLPQFDNRLTQIGDLTTNRENLNTWNGPYFSSTNVLSYQIKNDKTANMGSSALIEIWLMPPSTWASNTNYTICSSVGDNNCAEFFVLHPLGNATSNSNIYNLYQQLDKLVDNGNGALTGKVRYIDRAGDTSDVLAYQGINHKRSI
tara:strand:+ start:2330 stop:2965 length:636 start_codon:yes stop_codon:yes gene_type:complete